MWLLNYPLSNYIVGDFHGMPHNKHGNSAVDTRTCCFVVMKRRWSVVYFLIALCSLYYVFILFAANQWLSRLCIFLTGYLSQLFLLWLLSVNYTMAVLTFFYEMFCEITSAFGIHWSAVVAKGVYNRDPAFEWLICIFVLNRYGSSCYLFFVSNLHPSVFTKWVMWKIARLTQIIRTDIHFSKNLWIGYKRTKLDTVHWTYRDSVRWPSWMIIAFQIRGWSRTVPGWI